MDLALSFGSGVSRKEAFSSDLFGELENEWIVENGGGNRKASYGDVVQNGSEDEFSEEVCSQPNQTL